LISSAWYPAVQRDDVGLVTDAIERVTPHGLRTVDGVERAADVIVWCTGFRAGEYLRDIEVVGREGAVLHDRWGDRPRAYHGMAVPGFPNFFMMYGPNTNQGGNSILLILEAQAQYVASAVTAMAAAGASSLDVTPEAMARYERELERDLQGTVWVDDRCASYFRNAAGDIVTQLPHTSAWYGETTAAIDPDDYTFGAATPATA
jgi:cation diffusion facilitator CzcD-associated flavoprotein CzcO